MLAALFRDAVAELVAETLDSVLAALARPAHPALLGRPLARDGSDPAPMVVAGDVALGRALTRLARRRHPESWRGMPLHVAAPAGHRAARKLEHVVVAEHPTRLPLEERSVAILIGVNAMVETSPAEAVAGWKRLLRPDGGLILVDRCPAARATALALCAGLVEIEQRSSGRAVVTSGLCA